MSIRSSEILAAEHGELDCDEKENNEVSPQKVSGIHAITPCTIKSLKTSFDQTSVHCVEIPTLWQGRRLARISVNGLRIFRELALIAPRASVAFGNDVAEHFFKFLDSIADRLDGSKSASKKV